MRERSYRRFSGIVEVGFGALAVGTGTLALGDASMFTSTQKGEQLAGLMFGLGIGEAIFGIYSLTTEGPVESALHAYERSTGRMSVAPPKDAWLTHVHVGFVRGGATANVAMTF